MKPSVLLVLNTAATYTRSLIALGLTLFSSRWLLGALGEIDFGLFSLIGSILLFIAYLNSVLAGSASRHFAYAIGQGDVSEVTCWFNTALSIHLCIATVLTCVGWFIGEYFINEIFNIPIERVASCLLVFRISLVSLFTGMLSVPFIAMFSAKQRIVELSVWNMLQTVLQFLLAWYLLHATGDLLIVYGIGITLILCCLYIVQIARAVVVFDECKVSIDQWFDPIRTKEIFSFASWNFIGMSGLIFRNEGSAILLNLYYGPALNAAYGVSKRVATQVDQLAAAMIGAFYPEITTREGRGERDQMVRLSLQVCKFGTLLILLFLIPLMIEMEYVLRAWLITPPEHVVTFCRLILSAFLLDRLSTGYMLAINAYGRIAAYQATVGATLLMTLPLAWLFLFLGMEPTYVAGAFVVTMVLVSLGRVFWVKRLLQVPVQRWLKSVAIPCGQVGVLSTLASLVPLLFLPANFYRLVLVVAVNGIFYAYTVWFYALDQKERLFFIRNLEKIRSKLLTGKSL